MPSERATVGWAIVIGVIFIFIIAWMPKPLRPPQVALVVEGVPHYGGLRNYDWESAGRGGGGHYTFKVPEIIHIQNGSEVSIRGSWDRNLVEISCVRLNISGVPCFIEGQKENTFTINLPDGAYELYVTTKWESNLLERVRYEYHITVT